MSNPETLALARRITDLSLAGAPETEIIGDLCERLLAQGAALLRVNVGVDTLHPLVGGKIFRFWRGRGVDFTDLDRTESAASTPSWQVSPYHHMLSTGGVRFRFRYPAPGDIYPFPILEELAERGITDYLALVQRLGDAAKIGEFDCVFSSWGADGPGFTDEDVARIEGVWPFLAAAIAASGVRQITRSLVEIYLGHDAGQRVLRGAIERGVSERIRAVVWFSDLEGFTSMADTIDPTLVLPLLNDYAGPQVAAIHAHGGTVLKFIGDGLLAIFPVSHAVDDAAERALAAADDALRAVAEVSARRRAGSLPTTGAYLALHVGEVFYGNIGGEDRLDFTVIGPAVNEAARMSAMCRSLGQDVVVSRAFADAAPRAQARLVPLGSHRLRGVTREQALFGVLAGAPPGA